MPVAAVRVFHMANKSGARSTITISLSVVDSNNRSATCTPCKPPPTTSYETRWAWWALVEATTRLSYGDDYSTLFPQRARRLEVAAARGVVSSLLTVGSGDELKRLLHSHAESNMPWLQCVHCHVRLNVLNNRDFCWAQTFATQDNLAVHVEYQLQRDLIQFVP